MENQTIDLNQNMANCLVHKEYWGYTKVVDVCRNTAVDIPWSSIDYALLSTIGVMLVIIILFITRLARL